MQLCSHDGFTTQRGCRKHVKNQHRWYYYFDEKPDSVQIESLRGQANNDTTTDQKTARKIRTVATFDRTNNIAKKFLSWLTGSGGCKSDRQAQQIVNGCLKFLNAIAELADFRKVNGASETVWRGLSTAEMYLKRVRKTVSKMMRLQWTSELDIDALETKGHWATLEELLEAVRRYLPRYESVLKTCKDKPATV